MPKKGIFRRQILPPHRRWKFKQFWKKNPWVKWSLIIIILIAAGVVAGSFISFDEQPEPQKEVVEKEVIKETVVQKEAPTNTFKVIADNGYILGRYGNALDIEGNYAQLVKGSKAEVSLNIEEEFGNAQIYLPYASLNTEDQAKLEGDVKLVITRLSTFDRWQDAPIEFNKAYFGNTKEGFDLLPILPAKVAAFGEGDILLDDQEVYGNLKAMIFYSEGIRDENQAVVKGGIPYSSKISDQSYADKKDRELHVFMYQDVEDKKNFPTKTVWINVFFEDPEVVSLPDEVTK